MKTTQATLFELPKPPKPHCPHGGEPAGIEGYPTSCLDCNHDAVARFLRRYATYGRPGPGRRPGMAFPSGSPHPTPDDRAMAHALLDELGVARDVS